MDRRKALAEINKATIATSTGGQLSPEQSKAFIQTVKDRSAFGKAIRLERRRAASGELNKITSGGRLIRGKAENADDGYRAGVTFPEVEYQTKKMWLPWEVTEDFFHENIEREAAEAKILDEMTQQFALDWDDLNINGDTGDESEDEAFLSIDDGLLAICAAEGSSVHRIDASKLKDAEGNELKGAMDKAVFFAAVQEMPSKFINTGRLRWFMSPHRWISWVEYLTGRETSAGDSALMGGRLNPLGIPPFVGASSDTGDAIPGVPAFPDDRIVLADPQNFVRVVTWDVRRKRVTGDTDWELATRDKRGYLYVVKADFIILEEDGVVDVHSLAEL